MTEQNQLIITDNEVPSGSELGIFSQAGFDLVQRIAKAFSSSTMVPERYHGGKNIGNCIIAINMAQRLDADPLMVMQNLYVVYGSPSWSAQFLIASFNKCGRFGPIRYAFSGVPGEDSWGCRAHAKDKASGETIEGSEVTISLAKAEGWYNKKGSKWQTMPEQMLRYRAAAWLIRAHAPEIAMGLHTVDEAYDIGDQRTGAPTEASDLTARIKASSKSNGNATHVGTLPAGDEKPSEPAAAGLDMDKFQRAIAAVLAGGQRNAVEDLRVVYLAKCSSTEQEADVDIACDEVLAAFDSAAEENATLGAGGELFDKADQIGQ